jgi:enamine deaminase RidA (YjgF/YER057c/UK114 family)
MSAENRIKELGLILPKPMDTGHLPFELVRIDGTHLYLSGHVPTELDGKMIKTLGKVGAEIDLVQANTIARQVGLGLMASIKQSIGSLDRVSSWLRVFGMVNAAPGFNQLPGIINGCSELILEVFGPEIGAHSRSAVGMAELPFNVPLEIEAEVRIKL